MIITPNGYEIIHYDKPGRKGTVEKAVSDGFERALSENGRDVDYEFTIEDKKGVKYIHCEIKLDNGYVMRLRHKKDERVDLSEIERNAYQFLKEKL